MLDNWALVSYKNKRHELNELHWKLNFCQSFYGSSWLDERSSHLLKILSARSQDERSFLSLMMFSPLLIKWNRTVAGQSVAFLSEVKPRFGLESKKVIIGNFSSRVGCWSFIRAVFRKLYLFFYKSELRTLEIKWCWKVIDLCEKMMFLHVSLCFSHSRRLLQAPIKLSVWRTFQVQ